MVLGILLSGIVYRFTTFSSWKDSFVFGFFVWLTVIGLVILSKFFKIGWTELLLIPLLYVVAVLLVNLHKKFRTKDIWKVAVGVGVTVFIAKIFMLAVALTDFIGFTL